ncbi:HEAT repeat domain-containing protein [Actinoplanes sp. NBRC 101535]|uniref:HEAT repeat domain-containing protein n=1 Tax=Actinoplanes sp. NBRC 101535 TaxID=3032196 RepID=UPI0024A4D5C2|nr:HEAT repeat domain-containing protein [Actinoplanes sp. NBRC 101535]GLY02148.1 MerR family transcriptional regulator [Actinoplanes sp. NBRC 101535]
MLIGEVSRRSGVSARMLRHYDTLGLVRPTGRTVGNYREYTPDDVRRIFHVEGLRSLGLSLRQIVRALEDPGFTPDALVQDLIRKSEERLREQRELLDRLRTVDAAGPADWQAVARVVALLHHLNSPDAARRQQSVLAPPENTRLPADTLAEAALTESDPNVAGALRWALARSATGGTAGLTAGLTAADPEIRRRAVLALAELDLPNTDLLTGALHDTDPAVRHQAALALGARGAPHAVPALIGIVKSGPNDVEAAEFLGEMAVDPAMADHIMAAITAALSAADAPARLRLTQALAEMPPAKALPLLRELTRDPDRATSLLARSLTTGKD